MDGDEHRSRDELICRIRELEASQRRHASPAARESAPFPVFGDRERREFDASPWPIRIFDRKTLKYLAVNDAALRLYGYTRKEFLGMTPLQTRHPEERAEFFDTLSEPTGYLRHRAPRRHVTKSGDIIVVEIVIQDILFDGREARLSLTVDVTERVRMQERLRQREREFSALVEHAPDIIARFGPDLRYVYVNPAVSAAMGIPRRAFIGKTSREIGVPESLVAAWAWEIRRVFETREESRVEFECPCHGAPRHFEARMVPETGPDGRVETVLAVARDITDRKHAERELQQQKTLLETVLDNLPVGVFIKDAKTLRYLTRNRFIQDRFGRPVETSAGKTDYDLYPRETAELYRGKDREALETGRLVEVAEQEICGRGGDWRIQHVRKVPLFDDQREPWVIVGITDDITDRKRTELLLERRTQEFETLAENLPDCVARFDRDRRYVYVNAAVERLTGKSRADIVGRTQRELGLPGDVIATFDESLTDVLNAGGLHKLEFRYPVGQDERLFEAYHVPETDIRGMIATVLCIARDITERKQQEQELRRQKQLLDAVIEHLPVGITVKDARTLRYLLRNRMTEELTGLSRAETVGKRADELYPPALAKLIRESDDHALATGAAVPFSSQVFRHLSGRIVRNRKVPVPDVNGQHTHLVSIIEDLTDIETAQAALRHSEERLRQLISMLPATIFSFLPGPPFATTYMSDNVAAQVGWQASDFTSDPSFWVDHIHPDDRATVQEESGKIATEGKFICEYRFRHKDGSWRWLRDESRLVHDPNGKPREGIGIWMDITVQREEAEERMQRALRQRDALVREVHHRIKNHLQGIAGLLRQKAPAYPAVAPLLETVIAQMKSVALVYGLQSGPDAAVALGRLVEAICTSLEGLMPCSIVRKWDVRHANSVHVSGSGAVPVAVALNELLFNALKHCERCAGVATIEVDYAERGPRGEIRIANRGALPRGFDYAAGAGCGTGLDLVRTLLDPRGSTLSIGMSEGMVETALTLDPPLVVVQSLPTAA